MLTRTLLCFALVICAFAQQTREVDAKRNNLRATAKEAFDRQMAEEKAADCPTASTTYEFNLCFGKAVEGTDRDLKIYESAIHDLLDLRYPGVNEEEHPAPGPAGPVLTRAQSVTEFDRLEQLWRGYLEAATKAAFHQFDGGTGGPSFEMECHLQLVRSHMRELDKVYGILLRL